MLTTPYYPRSMIKKALIFFVLLLSALVIAFEAYCRWPSDTRLDAPVAKTSTTELYLLFHGTNGSMDPYWLELAKILDESTRDSPHIQVENFIWSPWSDNQFRAASHGSSIGNDLGEKMAQWPSLEKIHLFASSAGSYLIEPFCNAIRSNRNDNIQIFMTFLDPIGIMGSWDYSYGYRNYGRCADYAEVYLNTDDPVPGTNAPAEFAYNIDVTEASGQTGFEAGGHVWPVQYYINLVQKNNGIPQTGSHEIKQRGNVVKSDRLRG